VKDRVSLLSFNRTGTKFAAAGDDGIVYLFSLLTSTASQRLSIGHEATEPKLIKYFDDHRGRISDLFFSEKTNRILTGSNDGKVIIYNQSEIDFTWSKLISI
jgi:WD40 repeat protein